MIVWTVYSLDVSCGYCSGLVIAGQPVAYLTVSRKHRCRACAGEPIDYAQVDAARQALADRQGAQSDPTQLKFARPTPRVSPTRKPVPFGAVADSLFDPRAAATNDREE